MTGSKSINAIRHTADQLFKSEAIRLLRLDYPTPADKTACLKRIKACEAKLESILSHAEATSATGQHAKRAEDALKKTVLDAVRLSLRTAASPDLRLSQLDKIDAHHDERAAEVRAIDRAPPGQQAALAADVVQRAGQASRGLKTLASDPRKYIGMAEKFWNKEVRALAAATKFSSLDKLSLKDSERIIGQLDDTFKLSANRVEAASVGRVLGLVGTGLIVVSVVVRTLADEAHWATTLAKSGLSAGVGIGLGVALTGEAMAAIVASIGMSMAKSVATSVVVFSSEVTGWSAAGTALAVDILAAGSTIEVPPVAAVLLATGAVIAIGIGISALIDFLIDTWFGGPIPPSMRAVMHSPMATTMRRQMASPMFRSMTG